MATRKIVLVEDDEVLAKVALTELTDAGFALIEAEDGGKGLGMALSEHPAIILLDINLPVMDGLTVMKNLREDVWGKKVPVLIFTVVEPDNKVMHTITQYEPSYYLVKSKWKIEDIVNRVKEIFERSQPPKSHP